MLTDKEKWPINFLNKVFNEEAIKVTDEQLEKYYDAFISDVNGCNDIRATLYYTLYSLSNKRGETLILYYRQGMTLNEVGEKFNVTQERIRQIQAKGIEDYRNRYEFDMLSLGIKEYYKRQKKQERKIGVDIGRDTAIVEIKNKGLKEAIENRKNVVELLPIRDLFEDGKISVRLLNCLWRAGNKTVGDVIAKTPTEIRNIRNLGKKGYNELIIVLRSLGVELAEEKGGLI